jgi:hypothetical protein
MIKFRALIAFVLMLAFLALPGAVTAGICSGEAAPAHEHGAPDHSEHAPASDPDSGSGCQDSVATTCGMSVLLPALQNRVMPVAIVGLDLRPALRIPATVHTTSVFHPPRI